MWKHRNDCKYTIDDDLGPTSRRGRGRLFFYELLFRLYFLKTKNSFCRSARAGSQSGNIYLLFVCRSSRSSRRCCSAGWWSAAPGRAPAARTPPAQRALQPLGCGPVMAGYSTQTTEHSFSKPASTRPIIGRSLRTSLVFLVFKVIFSLFIQLRPMEHIRSS